MAHGLGLRQRGILYSLLTVQHLRGGSIPSEVRELQRLIGDDARVDEIKSVVELFFPIVGAGKRANRQHREAQEDALRVYQKQQAAGVATQEKLRAQRNPPETAHLKGHLPSSPKRSAASNKNQISDIDRDLNYEPSGEEKNRAGAIGDAWESDGDPF